MQFTDNDGPDQRAYPCRLIWAFSVGRYVLKYPLILLADNEGPYQPALMRRLIWACVARKLIRVFFCVAHHCINNLR